MKKNANSIVVVEGKSDASFLRSFINCEVVTTNGLDVPRETLDYLMRASAYKKIYILTDEDLAGEQIRDKLNSVIKNAVNLRISNTNKKGYKKQGVAESSKEDILNICNQIDESQVNSDTHLEITHLYELGLFGKINAKKNRKIIAKKFQCSICNSKTLLTRLNSLNITYNQLDRELKQNEQR
jgi:ribonuclease M5